MLWVWPLGRLSLYLGDVGFLCTYFLMARGATTSLPTRVQTASKWIFNVFIRCKWIFDWCFCLAPRSKLHLRYLVWFYSLTWCVALYNLVRTVLYLATYAHASSPLRSSSVLRSTCGLLSLDTYHHHRLRSWVPVCHRFRRQSNSEGPPFRTISVV